MNKNQNQHQNDSLYRDPSPGTSLPKVKVIPEPKPKK